jgi:hypothetical protein
LRGFLKVTERGIRVSFVLPGNSGLHIGKNLIPELHSRFMRETYVGLLPDIDTCYTDKYVSPPPKYIVGGVLRNEIEEFIIYDNFVTAAQMLWSFQRHGRDITSDLPDHLRKRCVPLDPRSKMELESVGIIFK